MKNAISKIGGRKMLVWVVLFMASNIIYALSITHVNAEQIAFKDWGEFNIWICGILVLGNGAEHFSKAFKKEN